MNEFTPLKVRIMNSKSILYMVSVFYKYLFTYFVF